MPLEQVDSLAHPWLRGYGRGETRKAIAKKGYKERDGSHDQTR